MRIGFCCCIRPNYWTMILVPWSSVQDIKGIAPCEPTVMAAQEIMLIVPGKYSPDSALNSDGN